jgi:hypothetical protein
MKETGVRVDLFCDVLNLLSRRLGDRGAEPAVMNEIAKLAGQLEAAYLKLPKLAKKKEEKASVP